MTKAQAVAMNQRFLSMDSTIKAYNEAYKFKYFQYDQASKALVSQDSVLTYLRRELAKKPKFKQMTETDAFMSTAFVLFSTLILYYTVK
jgi:hypothetical protein